MVNIKIHDLFPLKSITCIKKVQEFELPENQNGELQYPNL